MACPPAQEDDRAFAREDFPTAHDEQFALAQEDDLRLKEQCCVRPAAREKHVLLAQDYGFLGIVCVCVVVPVLGRTAFL